MKILVIVHLSQLEELRSDGQLLNREVYSQEGNDVWECRNGSYVGTFGNQPGEDYCKSSLMTTTPGLTRVGSQIVGRLDSLWSMRPILLQHGQGLHDLLHLRLEGCASDLHDILFIGRIIQDIIRQSLG